MSDDWPPDDDSCKPEGLMMVTDTGQRIPIDLKYVDHFLQDDFTWTRHWQPVIEGDMNKLMPHVIGFDGPPLRRGECVSFFEVGPGWDTREWGDRVQANSRHVFAYYENGRAS